jgi:hypothetical protein
VVGHFPMPEEGVGAMVPWMRLKEESTPTERWREDAPEG